MVNYTNMIKLFSPFLSKTCESSMWNFIVVNKIKNLALPLWGVKILTGLNIIQSQEFELNITSSVALCINLKSWTVAFPNNGNISVA
jgi:hypothetical protein